MNVVNTRMRITHGETILEPREGGEAMTAASDKSGEQ